MPVSALEICHDAFAAVKRGDMAAFIDLFTDDAIVELPFAPEGWPARLVGKVGIAEHLGNYPDHLQVRGMEDLTIHETTDPTVVIVEYKLVGVVPATGEPYTSPYIQVVTIENGKVTGYRDYWNPMLAVALAPNGLS